MTSPGNDVEANPQLTGTGCLVRLVWMLFGNVVLAVCLGIIGGRTDGFLSATDAVFWAMVVALIWLRRVDITRLHGLTARSQPATLSHWKRYAGLLLALGLVAWAAAHAVAWFRK